MADINMNTLHLHATDDEAWRIEIPALPELTSYGGFRCISAEDECLGPQYGSGPFKLENPQNGFLSESDYADLLQHAFDKKVQIITEINGPGHGRAALYSMKKRNDPNFFLHDPAQTVFDVPSVQYFVDNVMNPCQDSTYLFLTTVIEYLQSKHSKFNGFHKIIHMGGDEVAHRDWSGAEKNIFSNSPACLAMIEANKQIDGATWQNLKPTDLSLGVV